MAHVRTITKVHHNSSYLKKLRKSLFALTFVNKNKAALAREFSKTSDTDRQ